MNERSVGAGRGFGAKCREAVAFAGCLLDAVSYGRISAIPDERKQGLKHLLLMTTLTYFWRVAAGVGRSEFPREAFALTAAYTCLITHYDDVLDENSNGVMSFDQLMEEEKGQRLLGILLSKVGLTKDGKPRILTDNEKSFLRNLTRFREAEYVWYLWGERKNNEDWTFENVQIYKELTAGYNAWMAGRACRVYCPNTPHERVILADKAMMALLMTAQVYDDMVDFLIDEAVRAPNYLSAASRLFPDERGRLMGGVHSKITRLDRLANLAPKTFSLCHQTANGYVARIPPECQDVLPIVGFLTDGFLKEIKAPED